MSKKEELIEEMAKQKQIFKFSVIDNKTGEYPDLYNIALKEDWAKGLMYCDMEGFSINEDGQLILSDECGKFVYCPSDRFTVVFEDSVVLSMEEAERFRGQTFNIKKVKAQARKETAEEIFQRVINICRKEEDFQDGTVNTQLAPLYFGIMNGCAFIRGEVKELAKEYGVEAEECGAKEKE